MLEQVFAGLNINSLLACRPAEPYASIIDYLAEHGGDAIHPRDTETRTYLHDLPVVREPGAPALIAALRRRKSAIVPGGHVVTFGTVSPEQAFVAYSSVCFACYVKFMSDCLTARRGPGIAVEARRILERALPLIDRPPAMLPPLARGPFEDEAAAHAALIEIGRITVEHRMVDSYFGNLSYRHGDTLLISQTACALDELEGCIDPCPLDGSSSTGITASSELSAHLGIVERTGCRAILHGHPKFAVIISLDCDRPGCDNAHRCHTHCDQPRTIDDVPIVPGEVGTGRYGLHRTVPPAFEGARGVIVYGHGLFTIGDIDFTDAAVDLFAIEGRCIDEFLRLVS
jgi:ribulose-5-phosphate 4-epimerase/fuculose-1-phosphate aldolase